MFICHPIRKLLVSINHSSYLIYFWYNFFDSANETNAYKIKLRRLYWPLFIVVLQAVNELPSQHWTERAKIVWWYCTPLKIRLPDKFQRASFPCALGKHCLSNFLVQCCLRRIWTKLTKQYSYAMLSQHGRYNIVWVIFPIKLVF